MQVVCPIREKTATPSGVKSRTRVPTELLGKTSSRLYWLAILVLVSTVVFFLSRHYLEPEIRAVEKLLIFRIDLAVLALASLAAIVIHRRGFLPAARVLEVGLSFEITVALCLATLEFARPHQAEHGPIGISILALWILLFGLFVPNTPVRTLLASILSAFMAPLAYVLTRWAAKVPPWDTDHLLLWFVPSFLMAGWTYFLSRDIYQMEIRISQAREMGSYSLEKMLGKGGMGEVWMARHRRLCSAAAIKLIRPEVLVQKTGREAHVLQQRFEHEARATARLRSPHTVALHDFGVSEDGSFYYAMELLEGLDLEDLVTRFGPLPPARVASILRQVCDSLGEAHGQGLIHRDIKPSNIFMARLGMNCDFAKVLDFGLVKTEEDGATRLTMDGTAAGTPAYMAPELATGAPFDSRADIYSLGCVGYFLLTGTPVFDEPTPVAVAIAHVQKQPVRPSERTELSLPPALEDVIMRCLAKNPADRPQSAMELYRALAVSDGIGAWSEEEAERWWRVHLPDYFVADDTHTAEALSLAH
jgi:eukaryotic-like serine/threonine-protein kinase